MNFVLLNTHKIFPAPISGGIEKRIEAFIKFCLSNNIDIQVISSQRINLKESIYIEAQSQEDFVSKAIINLPKEAKIIAYNLTNESCKIIHNKRIRAINANCGGMAKGGIPSLFVFSSEFVTNRFLSLNQKISYNGFFNEQQTCIIPHGLSEDEFYYNENEQKRDYFLWCGSLGWGLESKGLDLFIKLAELNPKDRFKIYGAPWNSERLESFLKRLNMSNLEFYLGLEDQDKNNVMSNAIALCQFTRLIESCNITTLESYSRGTPVITLDEDQGGVTNNAKFFDLTLKSFDDFIDIKNKALGLNRKEIHDFYKNKFHCKNEYDLIMKEFNK